MTNRLRRMPPDPARRAVPPREDEHDIPPPEPAPADDAAPDPFAAERAALRRTLSEVHTQYTRLLVTFHRVQRHFEAAKAAAQAVQAAADALGLKAPATPARRRGGHPGNRARNDRLLALFEATNTRLPRLQRCRLAGAALAKELEAAGKPLRRPMPAATVRDAIAEALRHRAANAGKTP